MVHVLSYPQAPEFSVSSSISSRTFPLSLVGCKETDMVNRDAVAADDLIMRTCLLGLLMCLAGSRGKRIEAKNILVAHNDWVMSWET
jgi:hypothetical protein